MEENNYEINQKEFLPEAGTALSLSIWGNAVALLYMIPYLGILCCIVGVILSIMGLMKGRAGMELWKADKPRYHGGSFVKTLIAFILGILGIVQGGILTILSFVYTFLIFGSHFHHHYF